jgi:hypothetical protein
MKYWEIIAIPDESAVHENFNFFENAVSSFPEKEVIHAIDADKRRMPLSNTSSADYPGEESSFAAIAKQPTEPGGKLKKRKINMKLQNLIHILIGIVYRDFPRGSL